MTKVRTWVGLDVHATSVVACVVDAESGEMTVHRLPVGPASYATRAGAGSPVALECCDTSAPTPVSKDDEP